MNTPDYIGLDAILYNNFIAQAEQNGLVYTVRDNVDDDGYTLTIANGAMPPYQTTDYECTDDIVAAYPGLKWEAVEMEV